MSKEKKFHCNFCRLHDMRTKALASDDIELVKEALKEFSDLWLCVDEDLNYHMCVLDGSWPTAEEQLIRALAKVRKINNKCVLCGGEYDKKSESQICCVCEKIVAKIKEVDQDG